jgi:hypothetical protein
VGRRTLPAADMAAVEAEKARLDSVLASEVAAAPAG